MYFAIYKYVYMLHHNNQTLKLGPFEFLEASDHTIVRQEGLFRGKLFPFVSRFLATVKNIKREIITQSVFAERSN